MSSDDRSWLTRSVMSMNQAASVPYFYLRLFPLVSTGNRWRSHFVFFGREQFLCPLSQVFFLFLFFFLHVCTACHMFSLLILTDLSFDHDLFLNA